ncbi:Centrosomal protein of 78 kDa, partial [Quaeritorhiza haematococci]
NQPIRDYSTATTSETGVLGPPGGAKTTVEVTPIKRVNLCSNGGFGDRGVKAVAEVLREEIGVCALDLQKVGATNTGARFIEQVVRLNRQLVVVDLRQNQIDPILMKVLHQALDSNLRKFLSKSINPANSKAFEHFLLTDGTILKVPFITFDPDLHWLHYNPANISNPTQKKEKQKQKQSAANGTALGMGDPLWASYFCHAPNTVFQAYGVGGEALIMRQDSGFSDLSQQYGMGQRKMGNKVGNGGGGGTRSYGRENGSTAATVTANPKDPPQHHHHHPHVQARAYHFQHTVSSLQKRAMPVFIRPASFAKVVSAGVGGSVSNLAPRDRMAGGGTGLGRNTGVHSVSQTRLKSAGGGRSQTGGYSQRVKSATNKAKAQGRLKGKSSADLKGQQRGRGVPAKEVVRDRETAMKGSFGIGHGKSGENDSVKGLKTRVAWGAASDMGIQTDPTDTKIEATPDGPKGDNVRVESELRQIFKPAEYNHDYKDELETLFVSSIMTERTNALSEPPSLSFVDESHVLGVLHKRLSKDALNVESDTSRLQPQTSSGHIGLSLPVSDAAFYDKIASNSFEQKPLRAADEPDTAAKLELHHLRSPTPILNSLAASPARDASLVWSMRGEGPATTKDSTGLTNHEDDVTTVNHLREELHRLLAETKAQLKSNPSQRHTKTSDECGGSGVTESRSRMDEQSLAELFDLMASSMSKFQALSDIVQQKQKRNRSRDRKSGKSSLRSNPMRRVDENQGLEFSPGGSVGASSDWER